MTGRQCVALSTRNAVHHFVIVLSPVWSLLVTWSWEIKPRYVKQMPKNCARSSLGFTFDQCNTRLPGLGACSLSTTRPLLRLGPKWGYARLSKAQFSGLVFLSHCPHSCSFGIRCKSDSLKKCDPSGHTVSTTTSPHPPTPREKTLPYCIKNGNVEQKMTTSMSADVSYFMEKK